MASYEDRDDAIQAAVLAALLATGKFTKVMPAEDVLRANIGNDDLPAALVVWQSAEREEDSSEPDSGDAGRSSGSSCWCVKLAVHLILADVDDQRGQRRVAELMAKCHDAFDGQSLGGLSLPARTAITRARRLPSRHPYFWRELMLEAPYYVGGDLGHDSDAMDLADLL